ncbi:MAG: sigma-54-dependent Fis family transcriptional regulator [Myxococcales bacterium]|nr:sigma-54-dependent Fis family transcriptional regulator [Myxococcales bacterium]
MVYRAVVRVALVLGDAEYRRLLAERLEDLGCEIAVAGTMKAARALLSERSGHDIALVAAVLADGSGIDLIAWAAQEGRVGASYLITPNGSCDEVVAAMRAGAKDVLLEPLELAVIDRIATAVRSPGSPDLVAWRRRHAPEIIGDSPQVIEALETVRCYAEVDSTVLVTGESGTGKELVARALHAASERAAGPFIAVNCASIPEALVEAELFGHTRGAFTGAVAARDGRVIAADKGTLFLDEIGDLSLAAQAKLLRVLQDRNVTPVGADRHISVDVRVVAATHRNLEAMVEAGTFRADLYYRLAVLQLELPPLRARERDVLTIARHLIASVTQRTRRAVVGMDASAERALVEHRWPGNVRELANVIERAVVLRREGRLAARDLALPRREQEPVVRASPALGSEQFGVAGSRVGALGSTEPAVSAAVSAAWGQVGGFEEALNLRSAIDLLERQLIQQALERTGGNRTEAAALLGLNRTTLVEKLRKLG